MEPPTGASPEGRVFRAFALFDVSWEGSYLTKGPKFETPRWRLLRIGGPMPVPALVFAFCLPYTGGSTGKYPETKVNVAVSIN